MFINKVIIISQVKQKQFNNNLINFFTYYCNKNKFKFYIF